MSTQTLDPNLSFTDYYSLAWKFFATNFKDIAILALIFLLPGLILGLIAASGVIFGASNALFSQDILGSITTFLIPTILIGVVFQFVISIWMVLTFTNYVTEVYQGAQMTWKQALAEGWKMFKRGWSTYLILAAIFLAVFIIAGIIAGFIMGATGMFDQVSSVSADATFDILSLLPYMLNMAVIVFFAAIPLIILGIYWMFVSNAIVVFDKRNMEALNFSKSLVKGRWLRMFGYAVAWACVSIFVSLLMGLVIGILGKIIPEEITSLINSYYTLVLQAFGMVYFTIVFLHIAPKTGKNKVIGEATAE
ncbi:MAG: hypothetical protein ACK4NC_05590 [Candidatus Gracilibacteria bacterium]